MKRELPEFGSDDGFIRDSSYSDTYARMNEEVSTFDGAARLLAYMHTGRIGGPRTNRTSGRVTRCTCR